MAVQAEGQGLSQRRLLQRCSTTEQGDVADLGGGPHRFLQCSALGIPVQSVALVLIDGGGQQHIHFPAAKRPEQGG